MKLIPAIDLRQGRCVRLLHGDFDAVTRYDAAPGELLARYRGFGADWLHVVDLDAARDGEPREPAQAPNPTLIGELAALGARAPLATPGARLAAPGARAPRAVNLQVGGGMRSAAAVSDMLERGVARVVIGSAAVTHVDQVRRWLAEFGAQRIVLAFDVRLDASGTPCVAIHGWREQSTLTLWAAVDQYIDFGLRHVLCTDVGRDGALSGPNVALYAQAAQRFPLIEWQASGGIRDSRDLRALEQAGAAAAISGKALLDDLIPPEELQPFLRNA